ncbi:DUF5719 family protein [Agromyces sp. SYSU K20354]|uniref:DUF5719 family protein n=1 Tax=Agromyces cavernae TaxID=2898659 RepID=UPI001E4CFDBC|nr:DUF5719 family protein [Agromyces cavernae]MCD2444028.1 DUF5719 family protein [Agromyces cavernae]
MADKLTLARTAVRIGARGLAVLAAAGIAVGAVAAAALVPWPEHRTEAPSVVVQPAETGQLRVCPGPLLSIGDDPAAATTASSVGSADVTSGAVPTDADVTETPLAAPDNSRADADGPPLALTTEPGAVDAGMLAGAQSQTVTREGLSGFAAASCTEAVAESWLVGGATDVGRTTLVLLANPTAVAATVDLRVIGETGRVDAPSALGIIVPPSSQRVLSLAGLAPNLVSPVVHVTSTGGAIAASLEHSVVEGLTPAGVELVGPTALPAPTQVIPGFVVPSHGGVAPADDHAEGDGFPAVRLLATGQEPVQVSVGVVPDTGGSGSTVDVTLEPGLVTDVPLGELDAGEYTIRLDGDGPFVAAARATTGVPEAQTDPDGADPEASVDLAWTTATMPLIDTAIVAVPRGPSPVLHLANPGGDEIEVRYAVDGEERSITIQGGDAASVDVDAQSVVELSGVAGVHATVTFSGDQALASFAVQPPGPLDTPIRVYPR